MPFPPVPAESKKSINKAGQLLAMANASQEELDWAWDLANRWRACHAYPINTFQATLRTRLANYTGSPVVAQRLKRMPTIIDKLKRYPAMQLTTMQDIAGVRAVLGSVAQVKKIAAEYEAKGRFAHELVDERDYIQDPRSEDGYRSHHLVYKYRNRRNPRYDGLRLELQVRTKLQHTWATAVETMGTFLGQALKSRQGDQQWIDFFAITSSAFAYQERTPPVPRFAHLTADETCQAVAEAEATLGALQKMKGFSAAVSYIAKAGPTAKTWSYHLIVLNSLEKTVHLKAYGRDSFDKAMKDYYQYEEEAARGKKIEPVLVSAGPIDTLRKAYPNFFLDIDEFTRIVARIVAQSPKQ